MASSHRAHSAQTWPAEPGADTSVRGRSVGHALAAAASSWAGTLCGFEADVEAEAEVASGPETARREEDAVLLVVELVVVEERCRAPVRLKKRLEDEERLVDVVFEREGVKNSAGGESGGELGPREARRAEKAGSQGV